MHLEDTKKRKEIMLAQHRKLIARHLRNTIEERILLDSEHEETTLL